MSFSPFMASSSTAVNRQQVTPTSAENKTAKIIEKIISDLEALCKTLIEIQEQKQNDTNSKLEDTKIKDDCYELQKFCFKLEFLIQFNLKEKKGILSSSSNTNPETSSNSVNAYTNREYWSFFVDVLKSSRGFQDAVKYVKEINEIKSNLGRGRAFIRFCLQYKRLADAIQQITMEEKAVK